MSLLIYFIIVPLAAAFLTALINVRVKDKASIIPIIAGLILVVLSLYCARQLNFAQVLIYKIGGWLPPLGMSLVVDGLSGLLLVAVNIISLLALAYSSKYMRHYTDDWKFYSLFLIMLCGMNGVLLSSDLFNLYVFLEIASLSGYALVAFGVSAEDLEASFKYMVMGAMASIFILLGIAMLYSYTSTLNMAEMAQALSTRPAGILISFVSVLFLAGFGLKAALVPFHAWLPDAHSSAPSPVSAVLSGLVIKTLGIYALSRVFFNCLGISSKVLMALMFLGALSMVVGAFLALKQSDIKRMLAYSSISQIGYIVFALGVGTPLAILGALFHILNHAAAKSALFLNAGTIERATGTRDINKMGGLNAKLPVTGCTSLMGSMSISGIPPFAGFWSKLLIIIAAVQAGQIAYSAIAVIVSIVTLIYYLRFHTKVFFGLPVQNTAEVKEACGAIKWPVIILGFICLAGGLLLIPSLRDFLNRGVDVLMSGINYKDALIQALK